MNDLARWFEREGLAALERSLTQQLQFARIVLTDDWREARPVNVPHFQPMRPRVGTTVQIRVPRRFA